MTTKSNTQVTIASGAAVSSAMAVPGPSRLAAVAIPAGWTAADLGVNVSADGLTYQPLYQASGAIYSVKAAASKTTLLSALDLTTFPYVQLVSLTVGAATQVNQASAVVLTIFFDDLR